jgi:hypothetical protein
MLDFLNNPKKMVSEVGRPAKYHEDEADITKFDKLVEQNSFTMHNTLQHIISPQGERPKPPARGSVLPLPVGPDHHSAKTVLILTMKLWKIKKSSVFDHEIMNLAEKNLGTPAILGTALQGALMATCIREKKY